MTGVQPKWTVHNGRECSKSGHFGQTGGVGVKKVSVRADGIDGSHLNAFEVVFAGVLKLHS